MNLPTINIPITPDSNGSCFPYQFGNRADYLSLGVPLYHAASMCDWEMAKIIFNKHPYLVRFSLSENLGTALHVAVNAKWSKKNVNFVKNLVDIMTVDDLELKNKYSNTAFWEAAAFGDKEMLKIIMTKNHNLLNIRGSDGHFPLSASILTRHEKTVRYLYNCSQKMNDDHWTDTDKDLTLLLCMKSYLFDVAQQILEDRPELIVRNVSQLLEVLAQTDDVCYRPARFKLIRMIRRATAMMVTFSASFFVLYHKRLKRVSVLITALATVPVIAYAVLQFPLFMDMFRSMYDSRYLFNPKKGMLYNTKAKVNL